MRWSLLRYGKVFTHYRPHGIPYASLGKPALRLFYDSNASANSKKTFWIAHQRISAKLHPCSCIHRLIQSCTSLTALYLLSVNLPPPPVPSYAGILTRGMVPNSQHLRLANPLMRRQPLKRIPPLMRLEMLSHVLHLQPDSVILQRAEVIFPLVIVLDYMYSSSYKANMSNTN